MNVRGQSTPGPEPARTAKEESDVMTFLSASCISTCADKEGIEMARRWLNVDYGEYIPGSVKRTCFCMLGIALKLWGVGL